MPSAAHQLALIEVGPRVLASIAGRLLAEVDPLLGNLRIVSTGVRWQLERMADEARPADRQRIDQAAALLKAPATPITPESARLAVRALAAAIEIARAPTAAEVARLAVHVREALAERSVERVEEIIGAGLDAIGAGEGG